jgi:hemoglobin
VQVKNDIASREDIEQLVTRFYEKVKADPEIGFIFNDIAKVNWEKHLPTMFNFWENTLFYTGSYSGNPMISHQKLHSIFPLTREHFARWLVLFIQTVDELFEGPTAQVAKQRASSISTIMRMKIIGN